MFGNIKVCVLELLDLLGDILVSIFFKSPVLIIIFALLIIWIFFYRILPFILG